MIRSERYTARVECALCNEEVALTVEGDPDEAMEGEIDQETIRRAAAAGICPVDLQHFIDREAQRGRRVSRYRSRVWICRACAKAILDVFSVDATLTVAALPEATDEGALVARGGSR